MSLNALPWGEPASNAHAEHGVGRIKGLVRTLKLSLEAKIGKEVPRDSATLTWLVEYAAVLLNKYHIHF